MLTPDEIDNLPTYTAAQMLRYWQHVEMQIGEGKQVSHNGRSLSRADEEWVSERVAYWQGVVESDDGNGNVALTVFGRPR